MKQALYPYCMVTNMFSNPPTQLSRGVLNHSLHPRFRQLEAAPWNRWAAGRVLQMTCPGKKRAAQWNSEDWTCSMQWQTSDSQIVNNIKLGRQQRLTQVKASEGVSCFPHIRPSIHFTEIYCSSSDLVGKQHGQRISCWLTFPCLFVTTQIITLSNYLGCFCS